MRSNQLIESLFPKQLSNKGVTFWVKIELEQVKVQLKKVEEDKIARQFKEDMENIKTDLDLITSMFKLGRRKFL